MKRTRNQLSIDWTATPTVGIIKDQDESSSGDPMLDAVNDLFLAYDGVGEIEYGDIHQDIILERVQDLADRYLALAIEARKKKRLR